MNKKATAIRIVVVVVVLVALAVGIWLLLRGCDSDTPFDRVTTTTVATTSTTPSVKTTTTPNATTTAFATTTKAPETSQTLVTTIPPETIIPITTEPPVTTTQPPVTIEPPVTTNPPVTTEPPVTTNPPVTTEPPVTTNPPVTTEPPATEPDPQTCSHEYSEWQTISIATCSVEGTQTRTCSLCRHTESRTIGATGHSYGSWKTVKDAGCVTTGQQERACSNCNGTETRTIDATGHSYGSWQTTKATTCDVNGQQERTCSNCNGTETRTIDATGHSYGSWQTTKAATCDVNGQQARTCSKCGHVETKAIAATGHTWDSGKVTTVPSTCSDVGVKTYTCTACSATKTERITGTHTFGEWQWEEYTYEVPREEPFNTLYGPYVYTSHKKFHLCVKCEYRETVNTPNHKCWYTYGSFSDEIIVSQDCEGTTYSMTCTTCGWERVRVDAKLGKHDWVVIHTVDIKETECTRACKAEVTKCSKCGKQNVAYTIRPNYDDFPPVHHSIIDSISVTPGDAWSPNEYVINYTCKRDNIVVDNEGNLISFDIHWHDSSWKCYRHTIVVADVVSQFESYGYTFKTGQKYTFHFIICYDKYTNTWSVKPERISGTA